MKSANAMEVVSSSANEIQLITWGEEKGDRGNGDIAKLPEEKKARILIFVPYQINRTEKAAPEWGEVTRSNQEIYVRCPGE